MPRNHAKNCISVKELQLDRCGSLLYFFAWVVIHHLHPPLICKYPTTDCGQIVNDGANETSHIITFMISKYCSLWCLKCAVCHIFFYYLSISYLFIYVFMYLFFLLICLSFYLCIYLFMDLINYLFTCWCIYVFIIYVLMHLFLNLKFYSFTYLYVYVFIYLVVYLFSYFLFIDLFIYLYIQWFIIY